MMHAFNHPPGFGLIVTIRADQTPMARLVDPMLLQRGSAIGPRDRWKFAAEHVASPAGGRLRAQILGLRNRMWWTLVVLVVHIYQPEWPRPLAR